MMGTGGFALPTFEQLYETRHEVVGLFTQPDRAGRGHHRHRNPLKDLALKHETPVFQPTNVNTSESLDELRALDADLCVVAAYGQLLSASLLEIPSHGAINLHASLLPKYRGAAPVQYAILCGESETGVTIFQIEPALDAGPILAVERLTIGAKETSGELETRLAQLAAPMTGAVVDAIESESVVPRVQNTDDVTKAPRLKKTDGWIDWNRTPAEIDRHVRGMQPWPKACTLLRQESEPPARLILLEVSEVSGTFGETPNAGVPGTVVSASDQRLVVQAGGGLVDVVRLQPEGKRAMTAADFLRGHAVSPGDVLCRDGGIA